MKRFVVAYSRNYFYLFLEYSSVLAPFLLCFATQKYINGTSVWWSPLLIWVVISLAIPSIGVALARFSSLPSYFQNKLTNGGRIVYFKRSFPEVRILIAMDEDYYEKDYSKKKRTQNILTLTAAFVIAETGLVATISNNKLLIIGLVWEFALYAIALCVFCLKFSPLKVNTQKIMSERVVSEKMGWNNVA